MAKKIAIIAGAGPAGLTAAYELIKRDSNIHPIIFETSDAIGGISRTVEHNGNRIDIGGHRFFSKNTQIMEWWMNIMPLQGKPAYDDILLSKEKPIEKGGPDPETEDRVMLTRERVSRIFYLRKFFDYPISLKYETFKNMGLGRTLKAGFGYIWAQIHRRKEVSLEDFYINRFGKPLYSMFFEAYTQKVWGLHPSKLGADWGSQRVKGVSIMAILKNALRRKSKYDTKKVETSLIEEFIYPKLGPGQLWETVASDILKMGGEILMESTIVGVNIDTDGKVVSVDVKDRDGNIKNHSCGYFISSMPIKDLIPSLKGVNIPNEVNKTASELPYRDFITVGLLVDKLKIKNKTSIKTYDERVPDTWIYIQERDVNIGRLQVFNNWSPYMVKDYQNTMWIGLEFFCSEGDNLWTMQKNEFKKMAIDELVRIGIIEENAVLDSVEIKIKKAYPAYYGAYYNLGSVRDFLDTIPNIFCVGRNGQHRYNNMDHSMLTAFETVDNIISGKKSKDNIWSVNTEEEYHESK